MDSEEGSFSKLGFYRYQKTSQCLLAGRKDVTSAWWYLLVQRSNDSECPHEGSHEEPETRVHMDCSPKMVNSLRNRCAGYTSDRYMHPPRLLLAEALMARLANALPRARQSGDGAGSRLESGRRRSATFPRVEGEAGELVLAFVSAREVEEGDFVG